MRASLSAVLAALIALVAHPAAAQDLNYQTVLIGTRAMGMGGAFTGVADDPSAAFHNPAGLGLIVRSSTSANLSVIAVEGWRMEGGYGSALGPRDLQHDAIPSLPLFVGFVQKFGAEGRLGIRQHGIALSVVRPAQTRRRFEVEVFDGDAGVADSIRIDEEYSAQWYGVSYGVRVDPGLAFGVGGWLSLRSLEHTEEQFVARGIIPAGARRTADRLLARQNEALADSIDLVFRFGVLWQVDPQWRFGLMIQPGAIPITSSASIFTRFARTGPGEPPEVEEVRFIEQEDLDANLPMPWQLRIGGSYAFSETLRIAADLAVYAPIGGVNDPVETFEGIQPDPVTGELPSPGQFIATDWHANITANASIGFDAVIEGVVPLSAGIFTDLSAAPSIDGPSPTFEPAQVHGLGASVAGGWRHGDFDAQIGVAGVYGWGTGLGTNPDPAAPPSEAYLPRSVERYTVYFFINGTERAAATLVREILGDLDGSAAEEDAEGEAEEQAEGEAEGVASEDPPEEPSPANSAPAERDAQERGAAEDERQAVLAPRYLRSPWPDLATEP